MLGFDGNHMFAPRPSRYLAGLLAAPVVPAFVAACIEFRSFGDVFWMLVGYGALSVFTAFMPVMLWLLPWARHPLPFCLLVGTLSAPGPLGYVFVLLMIPDMLSVMLIMLFAAPLGALGGFAFWLCVVWRDPDFATTRELRARARALTVKR